MRSDEDLQVAGLLWCTCTAKLQHLVGGISCLSLDPLQTEKNSVLK